MEKCWEWFCELYWVYITDFVSQCRHLFHEGLLELHSIIPTDFPEIEAWLELHLIQWGICIRTWVTPKQSSWLVLLDFYFKVCGLMWPLEGRQRNWGFSLWQSLGSLGSGSCYPASHPWVNCICLTLSGSLLCGSCRARHDLCSFFFSIGIVLLLTPYKIVVFAIKYLLIRRLYFILHTWENKINKEVEGSHGRYISQRFCQDLSTWASKITNDKHRVDTFLHFPVNN